LVGNSDILALTSIQEIYVAVIVSEKGQVVIPKTIRKALGIAAGSVVEFELAHGEAKLKVVRQKISRVEDGFGMLKYKGPPVSLDNMSGLAAARLLAKRGKIK
jgi:AbrB family looped-hinge helix DNA binding protein